VGLPMLTAFRPRSSKGWNLERRQARFAWWLMLPATLMIVLFIAYPVVYSLLLTFSEFSVFEQRWFAAGFENYRDVFTDREFRLSLQFTLAYTAVYVPLSMALACWSVCCCNNQRLGRDCFAACFFCRR
jgi:multiple sugar transport system permease protein